MAFTIRTPAGSDRYSLTSDLRIAADDTIIALNFLKTETEKAVLKGSSPTFGSVATISTSTFPSVLLSGTLGNAFIKNDAQGFGMYAGNLRLSSTDGVKWSANGHIEVPNGGTGTAAINKNALDTAVSTLNSTITSLSNTIVGINNAYASKSYVDTADSGLSTRITNLTNTVSALSTTVSQKANHNGQVDKVNYAGYADSAGSTPWASKAGEADRIGGRSIATGRFYAGLVYAGKTSYKTINHNLGYEPVVVATAYNDDGNVSIVCSVGAITSSTAVIRYRNINNSTNEYCNISWVAM